MAVGQSLLGLSDLSRQVRHEPGGVVSGESEQSRGGGVCAPLQLRRLSVLGKLGMLSSLGTQRLSGVVVCGGQ